MSCLRFIQYVLCGEPVNTSLVNLCASSFILPVTIVVFECSTLNVHYATSVTRREYRRKLFLRFKLKRCIDCFFVLFFLCSSQKIRFHSNWSGIDYCKPKLRRLSFCDHMWYVIILGTIARNVHLYIDAGFPSHTCFSPMF